jgi:hypothetical protein
MRQMVYDENSIACLIDGNVSKVYKPYRKQSLKSFASQIEKNYLRVPGIARTVVRVKLKPATVLELPEEKPMLADLPIIPKPKRKYTRRHKEAIRLESNELTVQPSLPGIPEPSNVIPFKKKKRNNVWFKNKMKRRNIK